MTADPTLPGMTPKVVGFMCTRSGRGKGCDPITTDDVARARAAVDELRAPAEPAAAEPACEYGDPEQGPLAQYPCEGGCGCWGVVYGMCLGCWLARHTYTRREVHMLPDDDPRRQRVRD